MEQDTAYICWVSEEEKIVSFHRLPDCPAYRFSTRGELMQFVSERADQHGYLVQ